MLWNPEVYGFCTCLQLVKQCSNNSWTDNNSLLACTTGIGSGLVPMGPSHSHTGGGARQRISSCTISPRAGSQNANKAASILLTVQGARDGSTRNRNYYCQAQPPVCNRMWPDLPGLRPPYSRTASDQILEVGTAWERGYAGSCVIQPLFLIIYSHALSRSRAILYHIKLPVGKILDLK